MASASAIPTAPLGGYPRSNGGRWRPDRPYHVALRDQYIGEHWGEIDAVCRLNSLPFNATGEVIQKDGIWRVHEFAWQLARFMATDRVFAKIRRATPTRSTDGG